MRFLIHGRGCAAAIATPATFATSREHPEKFLGKVGSNHPATCCYPVGRAPEGPAELPTLAELGALPVLLDDDGYPAGPCTICDGGSFWAPAGQPPEWALWKCDACEPALPKLLRHACVLPAAEPPPPEVVAPSPEPVPLPPWTDDRAWIARLNRAPSDAACRAEVITWAMAAGGTRVGDRAVELPAIKPTIENALALVELRRIARDERVELIEVLP